MGISDLVALPFEWGSAIRGKRFFHPLGVLAEGYLERLAPEADGLPIRSADIIARVSKATGTPAALPDFIGLAVRIPPQASEKPWDILLVSSGSGVLSRAVALRPATSWRGQTLTTLMPLHYQDHNWWLRARITDRNDGLGGLGLSLDSVENQLRDGTIDIALDQACGRSDFTPLGRLTLSGVADTGEDVSFDPVINTPAGVRLHPSWLADLRASAYQRSREGRDAD